MLKLPKSILVILIAVFVASMTLQVCCHQDWSEFLTHEHTSKNAAHSHSHDHDTNSSSKDECGPHKFKDLAKSDRLNVAKSPSVTSFTFPVKDRLINNFPVLKKNIPFRLIFFNKAGPPIYLLNSVFLN